MNPTTLRKIDLDTWFDLIKGTLEHTLQASFLCALASENITCADLVDEDWDMSQATTRALSSLQLFEKNCGESFEYRLLVGWTDTYRSYGYDILADVKSMMMSANGFGLDGLELV